jgi:hypothetical protein
VSTIWKEKIVKFIRVKRRYWIVGLALFAAIAAMVLANAKDNSHRDATFEQSDIALGRQPVYQDPIEEVSLVLKRNGFSPKEVKLQSRRFLLSIDNRTDTQQLVFRLTGADGTQVRELRVPEGAGDWSELLELPAGTYTLLEPGHRDWSCKIVIP